MTSEVSNLAFSVKDLPRAMRFYTEVFDFVPVGERQTVGDSVAALVEVPGARIEIQFMRKGDLTLELFTFLGPTQLASLGRQPLNRVGGVHLAFRVQDPREVGEAIESNGGTVHWGSAISVQVADGLSTEVMYCFDPDGIRIELMTNHIAGS